MKVKLKNIDKELNIMLLMNDYFQCYNEDNEMNYNKHYYNNVEYLIINNPIINITFINYTGEFRIDNSYNKKICYITDEQYNKNKLIFDVFETIFIVY